jgi:hypothetical protein
VRRTMQLLGAALLLGAAAVVLPSAAHASPPVQPAEQVYVDPGWGYGDWGGYSGSFYGHWPWFRPSSTFTSPYSGSPGYPYYRYGSQYAYGTLLGSGYLYGSNLNYVPGSFNQYGPNYGYGPNSGTAGGASYFQAPGGGCSWYQGALYC